MSSAEPTLGADLYIKAVDAGLPKLCKDGGEHNSAQDYAALGMTTKEMARFLFKKGIVSNDENGKPQRNDASIRALSDTEEKEFLPLYDAAVRENEKAAPMLISDGKADYVDYLRDMHVAEEFQITETVTRVREEDMQAIVSASLNMLDAVREDPANTAFVKGLDAASTDALWSVLEQSNYLMPGENPDRKAPIGEQSLRGTPEEREAVLFQASAIVSNLELPETINAGDRPTTYAAMLRNAVQSAKTEEVEIDGLNASPDMFYDSDLTREGANSLFNYLSAANRMMQNSYMDTAGTENLVFPTHLVETTKFWLEDCKDLSVDAALGHRDADGRPTFGAPGIDSDFAVKIATAMKWTEEALSTDVDLTRYTGDDGGSLTQEGAMQDASWGLDNAFDSDADEHVGEGGEAESGEDTLADRYIGANKTTALNMSMCDIIDRVSAEALDGGAIEELRRHAGRAASEIADLESGRPAFGSVEEAMGADRVATTPEVSNRLAEVMTTAAWRNMNPARRANLRVAEVSAGRGPFKDYKSAAPDIGKRRMTRFLDDNMLDENGKPNLDMRRFLRDAATIPIVAPSPQEGWALRSYALRFVERDNEEHRLRSASAIKKEDLTNVEFSSEEAMRMIRVAEASGNESPALLSMGKDGYATLSHPDAPKLRAAMDTTPSEVLNSEKSPRQFGGHLQIEQLKAAVQTGADKITVQIHGENPIGVVGKLEERAPVKTKIKRYDDVVLS